MTGSGCVECGANTYSGDAATECTSCPDQMISSPGSQREFDCSFGKISNSLHIFRYKLTIKWFIFKTIIHCYNSLG